MISLDIHCTVSHMPGKGPMVRKTTKLAYRRFLSETRHLDIIGCHISLFLCKKWVSRYIFVCACKLLKCCNMTRTQYSVGEKNVFYSSQRRRGKGRRRMCLQVVRGHGALIGCDWVDKKSVRSCRVVNKHNHEDSALKV